MEKKQVLSCIQPTGDMHLGNYFGAIQNWVEMQNDYDTIFGIVDYHAMTMPYDPETLRQNTINMAIDLISCGINPANLFIQSCVPEHTELAWILNCVTPYGELSRQTQFKDKSSQNASGGAGKFISSGLFTYPVLQAADILIYHADLVPVGKDQKQHLELARNTAQRFNSQFKTDYFKQPECLFTEVPNVRSLADPTKKMSKSLGSKYYIGLFEDENSIRGKVQQAVTGEGENGNMSAGVENMFDLIKASGRLDIHGLLLKDFHAGALKYSKLKDALTGVLIDMTREFRRNRNAYTVNSDAVEKRILNSSAEIQRKAKKTLREVRQIVGLTPKF